MITAKMLHTMAAAFAVLTALVDCQYYTTTTEPSRFSSLRGSTPSTSFFNTPLMSMSTVFNRFASTPFGSTVNRFTNPAFMTSAVNRNTGSSTPSPFPSTTMPSSLNGYTKAPSANIYEHRAYADAAPLTVEQTMFILFNKNNREGTRFYLWDMDSLNQAGFDPSKKTVIITHGFQADRNLEGQIAVRKAYLEKMDVNYIVVDWSACSKTDFLIEYPIAMQCSFKVGSFIADLIRFMSQNGLRLSDLHLIGHSLGAHAVSQVSNFGIKVPRITGLDPTQVLYWPLPDYEKLDPSDADYVDIIHSNVIALGWNSILGTTDFFVNGGEAQPKCFILDVICSHNYAYDYYAQSVINPEKFPASRCESVLDANVGNCHGPVTYMGLKSIEGQRGIFYIDTTKIKA